MSPEQLIDRIETLEDQVNKLYHILNDRKDIEQVADYVSEVFKIKKTRLKSPQRYPVAVVVRAVFAYVLMRLDFHELQIASWLNRDRTTIYYYKQLGTRYTNYPEYRDQIERILRHYGMEAADISTQN